MFSYGIWAWILGSMVAVSVTFALLHNVYYRTGAMAHLVGPLPEHWYGMANLALNAC